MVRSVAALSLSLLGLAWRHVAAEQMEQHTFTAPFTEVNDGGERMIGSDWKTSGAAVVNSNFVRLTPDRQSKRGAIWSRKRLDSTDVSTVLKFRISGQGKQFFGDGIALWFIQQGYYVEGEMHGSVEKFTGFGIIMDTFKNTENLAGHRDIAIVMNDGSKTTELMTADVQGCNADMRYHEDRADFSIDSASRIRVMVFNGLELKIMIDPKNAGTWQECATIKLPFDDAEWLKQAHVGITASTGQLADNHDVLSLQTYSDHAKHDVDESKALAAPKFAKGEGMNETRFERVEDAIDQLLSKFDYVGHHLEHEMVSMEDHMKVTVKKLEDQEKQAEGRIEKLERQVLSNLESSLEQRITKLEAEIDAQVHAAVTQAEASMHGKIMSSVAMTVMKVGSGWKLPFFGMLILDAGIAYALYRWLQQMKKSHLL